MKKFLSNFLLVLALTGQPAYADKAEDIQILEKQVDAILEIVTKGQVIASTCASFFPDVPKIANYAQTVSEASAKSWISAITVKEFLDSEVPHLTGVKINRSDLWSYPPIIRAVDDGKKAIELLKDGGLLRDFCEVFPTKNEICQSLTIRFHIFSIL